MAMPQLEHGIEAWHQETDYRIAPVHSLSSDGELVVGKFSSFSNVSMDEQRVHSEAPPRKLWEDFFL